MPTSGSCSASEVTLARGVRAMRIENELIAATVLIDKGADIYELIYRPAQLDVLWKSPWGLRRPGGGTPSAFASAVTWVEAYEGGWQEIFPNGGGPATYRGVELNFHGEASMLAWDHEMQTGAEWSELRLQIRLARSPFRIERTMRVEAGSPTLALKERITNEGGEPLDYMWGHHPPFGAPFLGAACRIDTNARRLIADDAYEPPYNPVDPGRSYEWPTGGRGNDPVDLCRVPGKGEARATLGYLTDFAGPSAWYGITNSELGIGVGMVWPVSDFPHAWFWQEMHASPGFPWYKGVYVMAIEPGTSYPGQGLTAVMEKTGTHRMLEPGASAEAQLRAVFYESRTGVSAIDADGQVTTREQRG
jgi:hypothetical protein